MTEELTTADPAPLGTAAPLAAVQRTLLKGRRRGDGFAALLFLLPAGALAATFMAYPILNTFWMSLHRVDQFGRYRGWEGLDNYVTLIRQSTFQGSLVRTVVWTLAVVGITTAMSLFLAVMLNQRFRGRSIVRGLLLLPWAASLVVTTLLWRWMTHPDFGAVSHLVSSLGLADGRVEWLADPGLSFPLMIWIGIWVSIPSTTLVLLAGLQSIDRDLYEAVALDGARGWHSFRDVTLPMLRPILAVSILLNVIFVFNSFPIIWILTEGGPAGQTDTLVTFLYKRGFKLYDMGGAAAVSVIMFGVLLSFALIHTRLTWRNVLR